MHPVDFYGVSEVCSLPGFRMGMYKIQYVDFHGKGSRDALSEEVRCLGGASIWPILAGILQYKVTKVG